MTGAPPLGWSEIYERLARRPDRPDPLAWAALEQRVRAWTPDDDLAAETCAAVWNTLNLARGGAAFEGFVQGRFIELSTSPPDSAPADASHGPVHAPRDPGDPLPANPLPRARGRGNSASTTEGEVMGPAERLAGCLEELRTRNPRHHAALMLLYEDRATVPEAADALAVDAWTVRMLAARARQAVAQCLERTNRKKEARTAGAPSRTGSRPSPGRGRVPPRRRLR